METRALGGESQLTKCKICIWYTCTVSLHSSFWALMSPSFKGGCRVPSSHSTSFLCYITPQSLLLCPLSALLFPVTFASGFTGVLQESVFLGGSLFPGKLIRKLSAPRICILEEPLLHRGNVEQIAGKIVIFVRWILSPSKVTETLQTYRTARIIHNLGLCNSCGSVLFSCSYGYSSL